jgi:transitional endoplasmic reticulum ATPase
MSKFYGESEANLRKKFDEAEENAPSIIFLDEIDAIATKREETKGDVEKRVVAQLLGLMDGLKSRGKVIVIAATNMPNVIDPALRRPGRFDREIEIGVPGKEGRLEILKIHTRNMPLAKNVKLSEIAKVTHGFVGADLNALAKEAAMIVLRRILPDLKKEGIEEGDSIPEEILKKLMVTQKDFVESLKIVRPSAMREVLVETPDVNWEDIGGLEKVKEKLKEAVEWPLKQPEIFTKMGIRPPRGVLLYGPPGTGKTLLAKAVAKESESNFILVNGPSLLSKWVGESEKAVREIFRKARQTAPTILFFDEIDALVPRRGRGSGEGSQVTEKIVNQILTEMDGLESLNDVLVLGATNRPDIIDPALLRQGRFDRIIFTPVSGEKGRKKIFEIYLNKMPIAKDVDVSKLATKTEGYVGADIEGVCREAAMIALREDLKSKEVYMKHFEEALKVVKPSVDKEIEEAYKQLEDYFSVARAKQIKEIKADYFG